MPSRAGRRLRAEPARRSTRRCLTLTIRRRMMLDFSQLPMLDPTGVLRTSGLAACSLCGAVGSAQRMSRASGRSAPDLPLLRRARRPIEPSPPHTPSASAQASRHAARPNPSPEARTAGADPRQSGQTSGGQGSRRSAASSSSAPPAMSAATWSRVWCRAGGRGRRAQPGERAPYRPAPEWRSVERVVVDREAEDAAGRFGERIAALAGGRDRRHALLHARVRAAARWTRCGRRGRCSCTAGRIWVHGPVARVPVTEDEPRTAYGEYGTGKAAIEALLHRETIAGGVPSVVLHPGHISGPLAGRSRRRATWTSTSGGGSPSASRSRCPTWARRAAPRARRRRRAGLRARAHPAGRDRIELPRGVRAGDDAARAGRRRGGMVRPRAGDRARRLGRVRAPRRRRARARRRASTSPAASRRASTGPATCSGYRPRFTLARRPPRVAAPARGERRRRRRRPGLLITSGLAHPQESDIY